MPLELAKQLTRRQMPNREALLYLANHVFKDCIAITLHWNSLVIELPIVERSIFAKRLENLPYTISGCECTLVFYNGLLPISKKY